MLIRFEEGSAPSSSPLGTNRTLSNHKEDIEMKLTWLGHACFLLEQDGYTLLLDPYTGVEGYPPLSER